MLKNKLNEELLTSEDTKDNVAELLRKKRRKLFLKFGLIFFYIILIIASLFIY